tara:strand:+ start:91 stop:567 length:477 start_codon:yes stop_codon:yes gene_type:complete
MFRKILIVFILFLISCGPSEEEIQARIEKAVNEASSTTQITNNLNTTSELINQTLFEDALLKCELTFSNIVGVELSSDKKTLFINATIFKFLGGERETVHLSEAYCILEELNAPIELINSIQSTTSEMGMQEDSFNKITIKWKFDDELGLDLLFNSLD